MTPFPKALCVVDFETAAIGPYPNEYPPRPCGVAIRWEDGSTEYLAWGHASGNNCTFEEAQRAVRRAFEFPCLFHNAAFDLEVARVHMGIPYPRAWHDTLYMAFLCRPHAVSLSLKPLAEAVLGLKPEEKDALVEWVVANIGVPRSKAMEHVPKIPAEIVSPYAIGDVQRTHALAVRFWSQINSLDMWEAYERERRLMPWLVDSERRGVRVDRQLLHEWKDALASNVIVCDARLNVYFGQETNWDANEEVADRLEGFGYTLPLTETGKRSTALPVLRKLLPGDLFNLIAYRNKSATMTRTFVEPWLDLSAADGRLHTGWSPVRNPDGNGTRTGRIASVRPNLANIPNEQKVSPPEGRLPLPLMRQALLPEDGHVWLSADYSQQELRLLAHFEDGDLMKAYQANPRLDLHQYAADLVLRRTGIVMDRKTAKILGFSIIYGAGAWKIAEQLGIPESEAGVFREAYLDALPGVRELQVETRQRFQRDRPIRTVGGRSYFVEPPKNGRSFAYKGLNVLIQGSAADQTKEAIIAACSVMGGAFLTTTVYDEINMSVPFGEVAYFGRMLDECMRDAITLSVPVACDLEYGPNWAQMTPLEAA
jgi:DNA polymerase-1